MVGQLFVDVVFRLLLIEKAEARRLEAQACGSERDDPTTRLLPSGIDNIGLANNDFRSH